MSDDAEAAWDFLLLFFGENRGDDVICSNVLSMVLETRDLVAPTVVPIVIS